MSPGGAVAAVPEPSPRKEEAAMQVSTPSSRDQRAISLSYKTSHSGTAREVAERMAGKEGG